ncbi:MAG: Lin0512 family protein [Alphaproteobacteria bacterium]
MAWTRMVLEIGMGTDIRGGDSTKAAVRALRDALWHNSLGLADLLGQPVDAMRVEVTVGVPNPETVDTAQVLAVLPHGTGSVTAVEGGLAIPNGRGGVTLLAHAAAVVYMDLPGEARQ